MFGFHAHMLYSSPQVYKVCNGSSQLNRYLKKHFVEDMHQFGRIVDDLPEAKVVVGTLPPEWIEGFAKPDLRKLTKQVGTWCAKFSALVAEIESDIARRYMRSEQFSASSPGCELEIANIKGIVSSILGYRGGRAFTTSHLSYDAACEGKFDKAIKSFQTILSKLLKKDVKVEQLGRGCHGRTFVINVGDKKTVFKTFTDELPEDYCGPHGRVAEVARAPFVKRHTADNKFARFFMGKLTKSDSSDNGFMILRFVKGKSSKSNNTIMHPAVFNHVYSTDAESIGNRISSTIVDYGGIAINKELFSKEKIKLIRLLETAFVKGDLKLFDRIMEENRNSKEFQEVLSFIKDKLNKDIMESGCLYTTPEQLRMYEVFGVRLHPEEKIYMSSEEVALCTKYNLFDESQTMRMISNDFFNI